MARLTGTIRRGGHVRCHVVVRASLRLVILGWTHRGVLTWDALFVHPNQVPLVGEGIHLLRTRQPRYNPLALPRTKDVKVMIFRDGLCLSVIELDGDICVSGSRHLSQKMFRTKSVNCV